MHADCGQLTLKPVLDRLYADFNYPDSATDPIQIVRRFAARRRSRGRRRSARRRWRSAASPSVLQSIERVLAVMGAEPAAYVRAFDPRRDGAGLRRHRPSLDARRRHRRAAVAAAADDRSRRIDRRVLPRRLRRRRPTTSTAALDSFSTRALALDLQGRVRPGAEAARASATSFRARRPAARCKRLNLFLRWMVRRDALDLGVWTRVSPAKLIVPLDTHVIRVGRCLRLTALHQPGLARWRATSPRRCGGSIRTIR